MGQIMVFLRKHIYQRRGFSLEQIQTKEQKIHIHTRCHQDGPKKKRIKTYWPAGGGRGQNPENTAQGHSGHNSICPKGG